MKKPAAPATGATSQRKLPKKIVALNLLLKRSLIQPEAYAAYGETCLHTVISTLSNEHGIAFARVSEKYGNYGARFTRYTLQEDCREKALKLVGLYEQKEAA